jgi:hypothetical protein
MNFLGIKQVSAINFVLKIIFKMNFSGFLFPWTARNINGNLRVHYVNGSQTQDLPVVDCGLFRGKLGSLLQSSQPRRYDLIPAVRSKLSDEDYAHCRVNQCAPVALRSRINDHDLNPLHQPYPDRFYINGQDSSTKAVHGESNHGHLCPNQRPPRPRQPPLAHEITG